LCPFFETDALRLPEDACTNWKVARSDYNQRPKVLKAMQNRLTNDHSVAHEVPNQLPYV
jgi:hypothetical protein